jgi:hypothetical protein
LVVDLRRSGVNRCVLLHERIVLPRIKEVLDNAMFMLSQARPGDALGAMVADYRDAYHTLPVHESEKRFGVAKTFGDHYICFTTIMLGGEAAPLVWGRAGAYLMRSAQAMFLPEELLVECYVDDPFVLAAGSPATRKKFFAIFLLWMLVLGLPISWNKVSRGRRVEWCGSEVRLVNAFSVQAVLTEGFVQDFAKEVAEALGQPLIKRSALRRIAGRAAWAMGLVPTMRSFIDSLWAVAAELVDQKGPARPGRGLHAKYLGRDREPAVETARVIVALRWLRAFLARSVGAGELGRTVDFRDWFAKPAILITCDASPWGLGATLQVDGFFTAYIQDEVTELDVKALEVEIGSCKSQAVLEALAIAVAVRTWLPRWATARTAVSVRSDSTAALGALGKLASPTPAINKIAREVSLDVAFSRYGVDVWEHLPGKDNVLADVLSRATEPGVVFELPLVLRSSPRPVVDRRDDAWWQAHSWIV